MTSAKKQPEPLHIYEDEPAAVLPVPHGTSFSQAKAAQFSDATPRRGLSERKNVQKQDKRNTPMKDVLGAQPRKLQTELKPLQEEAKCEQLEDSYPSVECFSRPPKSPYEVVPPSSLLNNVSLHDAKPAVEEADVGEKWDEYPPVEYCSCPHDHGDENFVSPPDIEDVELVDTEPPQSLPYKCWTNEEISEEELHELLDKGHWLDNIDWDLLEGADID